VLGTFSLDTNARDTARASIDSCCERFANRAECCFRRRVASPHADSAALELHDNHSSVSETKQYEIAVAYVSRCVAVEVVDIPRYS
jgi:hypothetical protein